jgi:uncharacterized protein (DUF1330 family)
MPAYILATVKISDMEKYKEYMKHTPGVIAKYGGKFVVRGGEKLVLEGPPLEERVVLIEFPDYATAQAWYKSPEYQELKHLRAGAAEARFIALEGC